MREASPIDLVTDAELVELRAAAAPVDPAPNADDPAAMRAASQSNFERLCGFALIALRIAADREIERRRDKAHAGA